jgi:adenylylsulfate kinase-like enzyme
MIYWFIGQSGSGKTTLARKLKKEFDVKGNHSIHLDGDDLRRIFAVPYTTENLSKDYRIEQTRALQRFVAHVADQGVHVIVSTVNPYRDVREEFKASRKDLKEIYVYTSDVRGRESYFVKDFEPPITTNCICIKTGGGRSEDEAFQLLCAYLKGPTHCNT